MLGYDTDNNDIDQVNRFSILGADLDMPTLNESHVLLSKRTLDKLLVFEPRVGRVGCGPVRPGWATDWGGCRHYPVLWLHLASKVQMSKITENLSRTAKSSRQSWLAACVRAASTRLLITSRHKCLEICLTEVPHTS